MNSVVATTLLVGLPGGAATSSPTCRSTPARSSRCTSPARGHVPRRPLSAARLGLRRRGLPAHRRGGVPRARAGDPRPGHGGAGRHLAATSRSAASTRRSGARYVMYQISGGGYGGNADHDGLTQRLLDHRHLQDAAGRGDGAALSRAVRRYALHEGSGGAGRHRGGFGAHYEVELRRGEARASFVMDHGRFGPPGVLGGGDGGAEPVQIIRGGGATCRSTSRRTRTSRSGRRRDRGHDAGRRRLRRPARSATRRSSPRRRARLLHGGGYQGALRRRVAGDGLDSHPTIARPSAANAAGTGATTAKGEGMRYSTILLTAGGLVAAALSTGARAQQAEDVTGPVAQTAVATAAPRTSGPGPIVYLVDKSGKLGTLDLGTRAVHVIGSTGLHLTDIAFEPRPQALRRDVQELLPPGPGHGARDLCRQAWRPRHQRARLRQVGPRLRRGVQLDEPLPGRCYNRSRHGHRPERRSKLAGDWPSSRACSC